MAVHSYDDLLQHVGHRIVCVYYGGGDNLVLGGDEPLQLDELPDNVAIECEDCCVVLLDYNKGEED